MLKLPSFPGLRQIKPISLARFNLLLAIWLGLVLNFAFYQKIHQLTPYTNLKAGALLPAHSPKNDFALKMPTMERIHMLHL